MKIDYIQAGDYLIPALEIPKGNRPIGRYGRMHRDYLKEVNPFLYTELVLSCKLWTYLADLNEQAHIRMNTIIRQMMIAEGVTEQLKANSQMLWVQHMNSIHNRAEEIILHEMIYV